MSSRQIHWSRTNERHKDMSKRLSQDASTLEDLSIRSLLQIMSGIQWKPTTQQAEGKYYKLDGMQKEMRQRWTVSPETPRRGDWHINPVSPRSLSHTAHSLIHWNALVYSLHRKYLGSISFTPMSPSHLSAHLNIQACLPPWGMYNTWYRPVNKLHSSVYPSYLKEKSQCKRVNKDQIVCFHHRNENTCIWTWRKEKMIFLCFYLIQALNGNAIWSQISSYSQSFYPQNWWQKCLVRMSTPLSAKLWVNHFSRMEHSYFWQDTPK